LPGYPLIKPSVEGTALGISTPALAFLGVPATSLEHTILEFVTSQLGRQRLRGEVLERYGGSSDV
jgi:hypothetical protein